MPTTASLPCSETTVTLTVPDWMSVGLLALGVDDPAFTVLRYRFAGSDLG
jgi:hypothetical protein